MSVFIPLHIPILIPRGITLKYWPLRTVAHRVGAAYMIFLHLAYVFLTSNALKIFDCTKQVCSIFYSRSHSL